MERIASNTFDHFSVLTWGGRILLGKHNCPLGQITTDYLNMEAQTFYNLRDRIGDFIPLARTMLEQKDRTGIAEAQQSLNAVWDILGALPPYSLLPMDLLGAYNVFSVFEDNEVWAEVTTEGTERVRTVEHFLSGIETLPARLQTFREQVMLMLEVYFEDLPRRNAAAYGEAFHRYYLDADAAGDLLFPDLDAAFAQSFDVAIRFLPIHCPDSPKDTVVGEETTFDDLVSFLYADFYRGLSQGNAPRRCHNCGEYFLLTAGYNTCYCNNIAPGEKDRTCRKVGAHRKEAQGKANRTPAQAEYAKTYSRLKQRRLRGKLDMGEWNACVAKAQDLLEQSEHGKLTDEELIRQLKAL